MALAFGVLSLCACGAALAPAVQGDGGSLHVDGGATSNDGGAAAHDGGPTDAGAVDAGALDAGTRDAGLADAGAQDAGVDPADLAPAPWPLPSEPPATRDVDADLVRVLERDRLAGACAAVNAGSADATTRLRCGKAMFFDETFGTVGIPTNLLKFLQRYYGATFFGRGFSQLGMVADPDDADGLPIGLRPTTGRLGNVETRAFTCASCHFGQLPDGRYAVGYGNLRLDYGTLIAALGAPLSLGFNANDPNVHPDIRQRLAGPVAQAKMQPLYSLESGLLGLELLGATGASPNLTLEEQGKFLGLRTGTMDFLTKPLVEDGVWTVSRILPLWHLPNEAQRTRAGMPHELLSWTGGAKNLMGFLRGFAAVGASGAHQWTDAQLQPLADYIRSLRTPPPMSSSEPARVREGARLFVTRGCKTCHAGPSGEGVRVFTFEEMGTDRAIERIFNPTSEGELCCGLPRGDAYEVTRGIKAPRMTGLATQTRFLHNGSVASLDELFCLTPRDPTRAAAQTSDGHRMTCDGLADADKQLIIEYLRTL